MAIYPPNTTPPQRGLNYVWNFLGSSLKTLANALKPYLGGGLPYKSYSAQLGQVGINPITAIELVNDFGPMTYDRLGVGNYRIMFPSVISRNKLFIPSSTEYFGNGSICYTITNNQIILGYITIYPSMVFPAYDFVDGITIASQDSTFNFVELDALVTGFGDNSKFYFEFKVFN